MSLNKKEAAVLLSGGLDSATVIAIARSQGFLCHGLSFFYGQRHNVELEKAKDIAKSQSAIAHKIFSINLGDLGGSALTDRSIDVPADNVEENGEGDIPVTYVPARNVIFLSYALAYAEVNNIFDIFIGANAVDYSGYPDCRPEFMEAFEKMANKALAATASGEKRIKIHTPLMKLSKSEIIKKGQQLGVDYSKTLSCYNPDKIGNACGVCASCQYRLKGFEQAGLKDPAQYA